MLSALPSNATDLAVTSYTSNGAFRWRSTISPTIGVFRGDWVAAATDGDFVAVGRNFTSGGNPIAITIVRFATDGTLLWEAFSRMATVWAGALPNGDVCATGGSDALVTCWSVPGVAGPAPPIAVVSATPSSGVAPLTVTFDGSASRDPDGAVAAWAWSFGDGTSGTGSTATHVYSAPGSFTASLTVTDGDGLSNVATASIVVTGRAPDAPADLRATALNRTSIQLTWTNGSVSQSGIMIERCRGSGCSDFFQVGMAPGTAMSFTDTWLARRTTYRYRVRARNVYGEGPYSNIATARTNR